MHLDWIQIELGNTGIFYEELRRRLAEPCGEIRGSPVYLLECRRVTENLAEFPNHLIRVIWV